jgi:uncharacterized repeat protein (TIGR01451 family)
MIVHRQSGLAEWPAWFRAGLIAAAVSILCSCRSGAIHFPSNGGPFAAQAEAVGDRRAHNSGGCGFDDGDAGHGDRGGFGDSLSDAGFCSDPTGCCGASWRPPGIACPWPAEEYLCDGGDTDVAVRIRADWSVDGLDTEDTVAHFDTLDGRTVVEPSNRACVYAPRFGAVRRVVVPAIDLLQEQPVGVLAPEHPVLQGEVSNWASSLQRLGPHAAVRPSLGSVYRSRQQGGGLENDQRLAVTVDALGAYEDLQVIRLGLMDETEKPLLLRGTQAALVWTDRQAVQVILDGRQAVVAARDEQVEVVYHFREPDSPRLRLVKIASTESARPGETVDFTIRYDNVGDQLIGNVTLMDHLTGRLEYVDGSARASAESDFKSTRSSEGSLILRWEIRDPLPPGQGGTVRFRCRVR